jgi:integrase
VKGEVWEILPGWLFIEKSKNGRPRVIPMSQRILTRLTEDATAGRYIFRSNRSESRINDIKKGFVSACEEAKIENLTFHHLSYLVFAAAEMGVPEHVRRDILGHTSKI